MRIAIIGTVHVPVPPPKYGGTEQVVHHLIKGLIELGHEPIFVGPGDSKVECEIVPIVAKSLPFPVHVSDLPTFHKRLDGLTQKTSKILKKLIKRVDIVHSHGFDLKDFSDFPGVTTIHNPIEFDDLSRYHCNKSHPFVSVSHNQQMSCPGLNYVAAVYNGEDPEAFPIVDTPDDYLCFLGRFERHKNPHLAIQLAIALGHKIKIAGKIDYHSKGYFEEEIAPYIDHPLVEYLGELGFEDKVKLISHARCNLHPTGFREPFGLTVLEAAYCGTPTLAIRRGSMPELIEDGRTGVLVEDFIEGCHRLEECFEMNRRYIADRARYLFNHKTMSEQYLKVYQLVVDHFQKSPRPDHIVEKFIAPQHGFNHL